MSPIEMTCPGCQQPLTMADEFAGQQVRCPLCKSLLTVPEAAATVEANRPDDRWRLRTPDGQTYGPVSRANMETWVIEGRVSDDCQLCSDEDEIWRCAAEVYPVLRPTPVATPDAVWPATTEPIQGSLLTSGTVPYRGHVVNAHRGGIILALGILSWAIGCPPFGVMAWIMGSNDLDEMRQGTMDLQGQSFTAAGRLIGMLHTILAIILLIVGLLAALILRML